MITIIESGVKNEIYNISGNYETDNLTVVRKILELHTGSKSNDIEEYLHHLERPGQDVRYAIDDSKLKALGWEPQADFDVELAKIFEYYKTNFVW